MFPGLTIVITALEAIGDACSRKKAKRPEQIERQKIQRRNERAMTFFLIFGLLLIVALLMAEIFKWY